MLGKMATRGALEHSVREGSRGSGAQADPDLLLHPELLSQEFLLLTLEQKNVPVEDEVRINKDGLTDLYVQHVIPLPQRNLPNTRWGKLMMEKKKSQKGLEYDGVDESAAAVEGLRKRHHIVFDGSSTSTSIKLRKTENGAVDQLKLLTAGSTSTPCRRLSNSSDSSTCTSMSTLSQDINKAKKNVIISNNMMSVQKTPTLLSATGPTVVKLKRTAPKEESDTDGLQPTEAKKKIQHITWP